MSNYRRTLKLRIALLGILAIFGAGFCVFDQFYVDASLKNNNIYGFQLGAIAAIGIIAGVNIIRYKRLLEDEKRLQLQYNKENDERNRIIRGKAGMPIMLFASVAMIITGIIAGYFNIIIFYTLIITAICQMTVCAIVKIINMRRM